MESNLLAKNDSAEVDTSIVKISSIAILGIAIATGFGYFTSILIKTPSATSFTFAGASAFLFIIIFFLQSLFIKGKTLNLSIILGETIALSLFLLINNYSFIMLIAIALSYLALYLALERSRRELENQLKINISQIAKFSVPKIAMTIVILISAAYSKPFYPNDGLVISKSLINTIISPVETILKISDNYMHLGVGNFSVNMTLPEIAQNMASSSLQQLADQNNIPLKTLEPQRAKITESTLQMLQQDAQKIGLQIDNNQTIFDALYNFINDKLQKSSTTVRWEIFLAIFFVIFFTIKSLFWIFYWLIYIFIFLFYEILMALGFSMITYQQIGKEVIIL
jgi:hypothetical protein